MKKLNFFYNLYQEFIDISWPKWNNIRLSIFIVASSTLLFSVILYGIDKFFLFLLKKIFSIVS